MAWKTSAVRLGQDMNLSFANWSPSIWLLTAPAAIVTTNYLIHDRHQHFPYHILIPQLLVAVAIRLQRRASEHGWKDLWHTARNGCLRLKSPTWSHVWSLASTIFAVISLFAAYQAFFHLPSVLCLALVLALAPACAASVCAFLLRPGRLTATRVALLAICVFAILLNDYRLTPPGFGMVMLALGTHIGAHCCHVLSQCVDSPDTEDEPENDDCILWTLLASLLPVLAAAWISESPKAMGFDLSVAPVMLSINAIVGGIALANSGSLFARPQSVSDEDHIDDMSVEAPALVGLVFTGNAMSGHAVVVSGWQVFAFLAAFLIALVSSTYIEDVDTVEGFLRMYNRPTWRKVLGLQAAGGERELGLLESDPTAVDGSMQSRTRCSGKMSAWQILRVTLLSMAALGWLCVFFKALQHSLAFADREINPYPSAPETESRTFDIVVSYHDESLPQLITTLTSFLLLPNVAPLAKRVVLYAKNTDSPIPELHQNLTLGLPPSTSVLVTELPNIGREGETYLHHIIDNHGNSTGLADHTLFLQAEMHDPWYMRPRITQYFVPQTGFLSLWHTETLCSSCTGCRDHSTWNPDPSVLESVFKEANNGSECADMVPTYRGQFIASAPRIRANDRAMYEGLRRRFTETGEENPLWGYDLERLWGTVLQCPGGRRMGDRCPSMLSGMLGTVGAVGDCQCVDS
jgi:hypothetical protein